MKRWLAIVSVLALALAAPAGAQTPPGRLTGGIKYTLPSWFKVGFLDFKHDVEDARRKGRHVMAFMHLDECPYCERMLEENFVRGDNKEFMQRNFDVIGVNIRGHLDVAWIDGKHYTEKALAQELRVIATPTVVFLDLDGNKVLQLNGYREPQAFRYALEYVQGRHYGKQPFAEYVAARAKPAVYILREHPLFAKVTNFKDFRKPLAILFEDKACADCARFHDRTLNHPDVLAEMKKFTFVRLDTDSTAPIVDLDGRTTTAGAWTKALGLTYRPSVVMYNEGKEVFRMDTRLYHFHFKEALRYVSGGWYKQYPVKSDYSAARREELLKQGVTIDYSE
ncbi:MAG: thioredoxin family protein [Pseudomonadota bacterium]